MIQYLVALMSTFPDFHKSTNDMVAEADKVVVRSTLQGTHKGTFAGIPTTGKHALIKGSEIFKIEGTKILEW
jgi:predicted ester cyclase